jgi:hypothetical protein
MPALLPIRRSDPVQNNAAKAMVCRNRWRPQPIEAAGSFATSWPDTQDSPARGKSGSVGRPRVNILQKFFVSFFFKKEESSFLKERSKNFCS